MIYVIVEWGSTSGTYPIRMLDRSSDYKLQDPGESIRSQIHFFPFSVCFCNYTDADNQTESNRAITSDTYNHFLQ